MKKIRCYFTDFWDHFDYKERFDFLFSEYELVLDDKNPDYVFYSCFGNNHLNYNDCIKIFWCGENLIPDLNLCDYAISLSDIQSGDRTFHLYSYLVEKEDHIYSQSLTSDQMLNRKFCNFVYSNNRITDPFRKQFFEALSKYKRVDSGGALLNNMGRRVADKRSFLKEYKFTLAIENSSISGYTTEKIYHPFLAQSVPVYWGDPNVSSDYNPNSFVNIMDYSSIEEAVEEVIRLDNDDNAYLEKATAPFWPCGGSFEEFYNAELEQMLSFYRNIFGQPLEKARRRTGYGRVMLYNEYMKGRLLSPEQLLKKKYVNSLKRIVKKMTRK